MTTADLMAARDEGAPPPEPGAPALDLYRRLLGYVRPYWLLFALSLVAMLLAAVMDAFSLVLIIPFLRSLFGMGSALPESGRNAAEELIDVLVGDFIGGVPGLDALRNVCVVILVAIVLKNLFLYAGSLLSTVIQERVERDMRDDVYATLQRLPLLFFQRTKTGQLIARVFTDTRSTKPVVSFQLADLVRRLATAAAYLAALVAISWRLTLLAVLLLPILVLVLRPLIRRLRSGFRSAYDQQGELLSVLQETVSGIRLVKAYGAEAYEQRRFQERSNDYTGTLIRTRAFYQLAGPLSETFSAVVLLALVWLGARMVLADATVGPDQFLAFVAISLRFVAPVKAVSQFPARLQRGLAAAERFFEVLDRQPEESDAAAGAEPRAVRELEREIEFEDVWFEYETRRPVLRGVSLRVEKGESIALVGPSGAGKSTLVDLLPRFIEPTRGRVTLDGVDLRELGLSSLRGLIGMVSQEVVVFNDTVGANIAYGQPGRWSEEQVERAARVAHAHEFVTELPDGYETRLGDRGVRLSGGQRQRIGLARAVLRDPPILILDEATSSLDSHSERLIQDAIGQLLVGRTVFVIAHRLSTVQGADRIVVLRQGRVVEQGSHEELHARGGLYRKLYEMQFRDRGAAVE